jgi:hypothetical protein
MEYTKFPNDSLKKSESAVFGGRSIGYLNRLTITEIVSVIYG